jgi:hypothetical protein
MSLGLAAVAPAGFGQEQIRESLAGDELASQKKALIPGDYNIRMGAVGLRTEFNLGFEYNDNIYWSSVKRESDFIIHPEVKLKTHWQISRANTLTFGVGIGYDYYIENTDLNPDVPLISPDSALAFNIFTGDFKINLHERFYYQESLSYGSYIENDGVFLNVGNQAVLGRYDNRLGVQVDWDLNDLILTVGYDHENFWTAEETFSYADRVSEWFTASLTFLLSPQIQLGLEGHANYHNYDEDQIPDHWRIGGGPFVGWSLSPNLNLRVGGGYEAFFGDDPRVEEMDENNFYAYGQINHRINSYINHNLSAGHRNELGFSGYNLEQTYFQYTAMWNILRNVDLSTFASVFFAKETGISFEEDYTYLQAGINLGYQLHEHWRATLGYTYTEKMSDVDFRDYYQNRVRAGLVYRF